MSTTCLPKSLYRYFWDINPENLNPQKRSQYVIQRLLELGDEKAIRWVRRNFSEKEIAKTVKRRRGFSPRTANFWAAFLKIPRRQVKCLQKPYLAQHAVHWPF